MTQSFRRSLGIAVAALAAVTLVTSATAAPTRHAARTLTFCSDITYPPEEFYQGTKPAGSDIDIGNEVAKRMGRTARFANTGFDGIIAALLAKKCEAIISGMNDTPARRKQVSFIDYLSVGQSLMVKKGNPSHIGGLSSLSGKRVSVEVGTTNKDFLDQQSKRLKAQGKPSIKVQAFPHDTDAAAALKTGKVDAYFGDSPVVAYYIERDSSFAFAGQPINPIPVGIAVRKDDTATRSGIQKAITAMYADGTIKRILAKWHMSAFALKKK
jgi:polar amino acid transport system substrate-binding protein